MSQAFRFIDQESQGFLMEFSDLHNTEVVQKLKKETQQLSQIGQSLSNITHADQHQMKDFSNMSRIHQQPSRNMQQNYKNNRNNHQQERDLQRMYNQNYNANQNQYGQQISAPMEQSQRSMQQQQQYQQYKENQKQSQLYSEEEVEEGEDTDEKEKENEIVQYQFKEMKKKMIQRNQDEIIDEIYKFQKDLIMKETLEKQQKSLTEDLMENSEQQSQSIINQSSNLTEQQYNGFGYSINNGQVLNFQRQQKQDIMKMLNPPTYLKQNWNVIQKGIEDRLIPQNEDGLPKNQNPIEKSILQERENGYKKLNFGGLESDGECSEDETVSNEVLITRKIVKILEEFKDVQKRDQDSIFHIALKQYCEKFRKKCDYLFSEERESKIQGFLCEVVIDGIRMGPQLAKSKRDAKTQACMSAIARIMQQAPDMRSIEYFQKFLENSRTKYIRLNENIAEAISQHHQQGGLPLSTDNPLSDLAIAQEIPENSNYREELSTFAHKNLHKQIFWETLFDPKEKLWLAIVAVGNLSERGFGRSKKYAKNVASYKLLQRCKQLRMKDDIFKNPRKVKTQLQFALNLQEEDEEEEISQMQDSLITIKPTQKMMDNINKKRAKSRREKEEKAEDPNKKGDEGKDTDEEDDDDESEPDLKKKQKQSEAVKSSAQIKIRDVIACLEEKYIDYYKLELSSHLNQPAQANQAHQSVDVFKQLQKYDQEISATKAQYQSLQNMYNEVYKKLITDQTSTYLKKLIPIGSYVNNCMNKYSTTMDVVALLTPSQEQADNCEINRFSDILYSEVQQAILNCNIGYFFKMELNKGCVMLVFSHNPQYKVRLIPNLLLEENILNKRKLLQMTENPLNVQVKQITDPNESKYYGDSLLHQIWLSQYKTQIHEYESLFRIFRRVFKFQGFKVPIDLIDVIIAHVSQQFGSSSFKENIVGFVKFLAHNGLDDIINDNLSMVQITQLHLNQIKSCSDFELKKIQEYFITIYQKKAYDNLIII